MSDRQAQPQQQVVSTRQRPATSRADPAGAAPWSNRIVGQSDVPPGELIANPLNWRRHPKAQRAAIRGALGAVGWVQRVIRNVRTGHLLDGHARVEEALARGEPSIPVLDVDLSEAEERLVLASFDPIGALATADGAQLDELLAGLTPDDDALRAMLENLARVNGLDRSALSLTDPDDIPVLPADPYVRPGQRWTLGRHTLLVADATDPAQVARLMAGEVAECLWTDPPYGVGYEGKTRDRLRIANDEPAAVAAVVAGAFAIAPLAPSARFYVAAPGGPRSLDFRLAIAAAGWRLHEELVWLKSSIVLGHADYHMQHETILYGYTPGPGRPGRGRHAGTKWYGDNSQSSVLEYPRPAANRDHPTSKPVGLVSRCLGNSTRPGDLVLDPFLGSGSTLIAAERLGRRCFGLEIEPRYAQVTIERWQRFSGQTAVCDD